MFSKVLVVMSSTDEIHYAFERAFYFLKRLPKDNLIHIDALCLSPHAAPQIASVKNNKIEYTTDEFTKTQHQLDTYLNKFREICEAECNNITIDSYISWTTTVSDTILAFSEELKSDLIIRTTRGKKEGFTPIDWYILRQSKVPVMLVHQKPWKAVDNVALAIKPTDNTEYMQINEDLFKFSNLLLNSVPNISLNVVASYNRPTIASYEAIGVDMINYDFNELNTKELNDQCISLCKQHGIEKDHVHLEYGPAHVTIPDFAEEHNVSMLLLGTSAKQKISSFLLGNTAEKIISKIHCDLLVFKEHK